MDNEEELRTTTKAKDEENQGQGGVCGADLSSMMSYKLTIGESVTEPNIKEDMDSKEIAVGTPEASGVTDTVYPFTLTMHPSQPEKTSTVHVPQLEDSDNTMYPAKSREALSVGSTEQSELTMSAAEDCKVKHSRKAAKKRKHVGRNQLMCPMQQNSSTTYPIQQNLSTTYPMQQNPPTTYPMQQNLSTMYPVQPNLSTLYPVAQFPNLYQYTMAHPSLIYPMPRYPPPLHHMGQSQSTVTPVALYASVPLSSENSETSVSSAEQRETRQPDENRFPISWVYHGQWTYEEALRLQQIQSYLLSVYNSMTEEELAAVSAMLPAANCEAAANAVANAAVNNEEKMCTVDAKAQINKAISLAEDSEATMHPAQNSESTKYAAENRESTMYPAKDSLATTCPTENSGATTCPAENGATTYPAEDSEAIIYLAGDSEGTIYLAGDREETTCPAEDSGATMYPAEDSGATMYPEENSGATTCPAEDSGASVFTGKNQEMRSNDSTMVVAAGSEKEREYYMWRNELIEVDRQLGETRLKLQRLEMRHEYVQTRVFGLGQDFKFQLYRESPIQQLIRNLTQQELRSPGPIGSLPDSVLYKIFRYVPLWAIVTKTRHVCKKWFILCKHPILWCDVALEKLFPEEIPGYEAQLLSYLRYGHGILHFTGVYKLTTGCIGKVLYYMPDLRLIQTPVFGKRQEMVEFFWALRKYCQNVQHLKITINFETPAQYRRKCDFTDLLYPNINLTHLKIEAICLPEHFLCEIPKNFPKLDQLLVDTTLGISSHEVEQISTSSLKLTKFYLHCLGAMTLAGIKNAALMTSLTYLRISLCFDSQHSFCQSTSDISRALRIIAQGCTNIICLDLTNMDKCDRRMNDSNVLAAIKHLPHLQDLGLRYLNVTKKSLDHIKKCCPELTQLTLMLCNNIPEKAVLKFVRSVEETLEMINVNPMSKNFKEKLDSCSVSVGCKGEIKSLIHYNT